MNSKLIEKRTPIASFETLPGKNEGISQSPIGGSKLLFTQDDSFVLDPGVLPELFESPIIRGTLLVFGKLRAATFLILGRSHDISC